MSPGYRRGPFVFALAIIGALIAAAPAGAGKLYQLEYSWTGPVPTLPATITLNVYKDSSELQGTSSETFNGNGDIPNHYCDAVACLTDTRIAGGELRIQFVATGYDHGKFESNSTFEIVVNGASSTIQQHTSCSQPIALDVPMPGSPFGEYTITGGVGECLPGDTDCPEGNKLYELQGQFCMELQGCTPSTVTLNVYKDTDQLVGVATADIVGAALTNIVCDPVACLTGAFLSGPDLCLQFETLGSKPDGSFESWSSWEFVFDGTCGTHKSERIHTSCSQPLAIGAEQPMSDDEAHHHEDHDTLMFTGGCGACLVIQPISVEKVSWGELKGQYRR